MAAKLNPKKLRENTGDLLNTLANLKRELATARVARNTKGRARIGTVRKNIARVLTVHNETRKAEYKAGKGLKQLPRNLRPKLTRALRLRLTKKQQNLTTVREAKRAQNFPVRKYAVSA